MKQVSKIVAGLILFIGVVSVQQANAGCVAESGKSGNLCQDAGEEAACIYYYTVDRGSKGRNEAAAKAEAECLEANGGEEVILTQ